LAVESGLKIFEVDAMYVSDVWTHINAYVNKRNDQYKTEFYHMRNICYTIHLHTDLKKHTKDIDKFMPAPWEEKEGKPKIARTPQEIEAQYLKGKAARAEAKKKQQNE
jgi:hypothetical protein